MLNIIKCEKCHSDVYVKMSSGFAHLYCEHCGSEYQLAAKSIKYYLLIPFIAVGITVLFRIYLINTEDIFIKAVIILIGSYIIYFLLCLLLIKLNILKYCKRIGG